MLRCCLACLVMLAFFIASGCGEDAAKNAEADGAASDVAVAAVGGVRVRLVVPLEAPEIGVAAAAALAGDAGEVMIRRGVPSGGLDSVGFALVGDGLLRVLPYEGEQATRFVIELRVAGNVLARAETAVVIVRDLEPDRVVDALWVPRDRAVALVDGQGAALMVAVASGATSTPLDGARLLIAGGAPGLEPCGAETPTAFVDTAHVVATSGLHIDSVIDLVDARAFHGAAALAGGRVALLGGYLAKGGEVGVSAGVEIVVPHEGRSEGASFSLAQARARFAVVADAERIVLVGGDNGGAPGSAGTVELWQATSGTLATATLTRRRVAPYAALLTDPASERKLLFVVGGRAGSGADSSALADGEVYEVRPDALLFAGTIPSTTPVVGDAAWTAIPAALAIVRAGGHSVGAPVAQVQLFDAATGTWQQRTPLFVARSCMASSLIDGEWWLIGGAGDAGAAVAVDRVVIGAQSTQGVLTAGRRGGEILPGPGPTLLLSGGVAEDGTPLGLAMYWPSSI
jgi:hypothetical protein